LREIAPALFATMPPPPLAIGTYDVLVERLGLDAAGARDLAHLMSHHVERPGYQKGLAAEGAVRLDLEDLPAGEVTETQRQMAVKKLERLKAKLKAAKSLPLA
jgi:sRNA-binding protein